MPSTWVTAGISARFSSIIGKTFSINGTSSFTSKNSVTCSFNIDGAKGRKLSLRLIFELRSSFASFLRGSASMERPPRARGPNSARPLNQPTTPPSMSRSEIFSKSSSSSNSVGDIFSFQELSISSFKPATCIGCFNSRLARKFDQLVLHIQCGSCDIPASCPADGIYTFLKDVFLVFYHWLHCFEQRPRQCIHWLNLFFCASG